VREAAPGDHHKPLEARGIVYGAQVWNPVSLASSSYPASCFIHDDSSREGTKKAARFGGRLVGPLTKRFILRSVRPIASFVLGGLDLYAGLLAGVRNESPDAMRLPAGGFHNLGQCGALGPAQ